MGMRNAEAKELPGTQGQRPPMTPRQAMLSWMWGFYSCQAYQSRSHDWNGNPAFDKVQHETIASQQAIPPGFVDAGGQMADLPVNFRKPTAPYFIVRAIVNRFTGLLFSSKRNPAIQCSDDPQTEDWLQGFAKDSRLWSQMSLARTYGGAMRAVGVGFRFVRGRPVVEVHDPRWCEVAYVDRNTGELRRFEKRYAYEEEVEDPVTRQTTRGWFWYRRVIDRNRDSTWQGVAAEEGLEPEWHKIPHHEHVHGFGFVPVVWIQNMPSEEGTDGWSDVEGVHDLQEAIDALQAQAHKGTLNNCDPTPIISSDTEDEFGDGMGALRKGSNNGLQVEKGGEVNYLEMSGGGIEAAGNLIERYRDQAQEVSRCVLAANFDGPARTEQEVEQNYSSMLEAADMLREQYGDGVRKLLEMALRAARMMQTPRAVGGENVTVIRQVVRITPSVDNGERRERVLGDGEVVELQWPEYRQHSLDDTGKAVGAAAQAKQAGLIDQETAVKFIAPYFHIKDVKGVAQRALEEARQAEDALAAEIEARSAGGDQSSGVEGGGIEDDLAAIEPDAAAMGGAAVAAAEGGNVQQQALNGAQVTAIVDILDKAALGEIPRESAVEVIVASFPVTRDQAEKMLGSIGNGFVPAAKATPPKPGAAPPIAAE